MLPFLKDGDLVCDGFDEAIIGIAIMKDGTRKVIYSQYKCIEILMRDNLSESEAWEYFEYNLTGALVGKQTPLFIEDVDYD